MKLSVILPCHNGAATIAVQLEALTRQQWFDEWEVIVVNNGSTDNSMQIVETYRDRLPQLQIVDAYEPPGPLRGVTHSYTVGFRVATGKAFVLCEADDEVGQGWLTAMGNALQQWDFVAAALDYSRLNEAWLVEGWRQQTREVGLSTSSPPLFLPFASGCSFGLRRSVYDAVGPLDEACTASWDTDYCWRAYQVGIQLHFVPEATVHYRVRRKLSARYGQGHAWGKAHVMLLRKYGPTPTLRKVVAHYVYSSLRLLEHIFHLSRVRNQHDLADWCWNLGWSVGDWQGGEYLWAAAIEQKASQSNLSRTSVDS